MAVRVARGRARVGASTGAWADAAATCASTVAFVVTVGPTAVPTMPQWAMIALAGLLGLGGVVALRRRTI